MTITSRRSIDVRVALRLVRLLAWALRLDPYDLAAEVCDHLGASERGAWGDAS